MARIIKLPQHSDTALQQFATTYWHGHYGYARSYETRQTGDKGQDYITFGEDGDSIAFALCDGISLSYFGDVAAQLLGDQLLYWLLKLDIMQDQATITKDLAEHLQIAAIQAADVLHKHDIPSTIRGVLREVLMDKKKLGSGSVYACGKIQLPSVACPKGSLLLAWQGDMRIRLWHREDELSHVLGDTFHVYEHWMTGKGTVGGNPHLYMNSLSDGIEDGSLLIYSDGLSTMDSVTHISEAVLRQHITQAANDPSGDDVSLFQISWPSITF